MDLIKAIQQLREEKARIEEVIARLEALTLKRSGEGVSVPVRGRRGRKYMAPEERAQVSLRMKEYWAKRRKMAARPAKAAASAGTGQ